MSIKVMSAVWECEELDASERLVMLSLADHADDEGRCYPSIARLCRRTSMSDRGVQKVISRLSERGFITIKPNAGQGGANLYFLTSTTEPGSPPEQRSPRTTFTTPPNPVRKTPEPRSPKPSGTIIEPSEDRAREAKPRRKPEVPLPPDWVPSDRNIADAEARQFSAQEIHDEADRFRNHHIARDTRFMDWDAAWRTWLGNSRKFEGRGMAGKASPGGYGQGGSIASIAARRRASGAV